MLIIVEIPFRIRTEILNDDTSAATLRRLDQASGKYRKSSVLGTVQFDFPIGGPDDRLADEIFHAAVVRTFMTADRTRLVRISVDVNYVGH